MRGIEVNYHYPDAHRDFAFHDANRAAFQQLFGTYLRSEPGLSGRVLDIGCGHSVNRSFKVFADRLGQLDGVDPFPVTEHPTHLVNRWSCKLEDVPVEPCTYDMAYSYMVVEHVEDILSFLKKTIEILKPGAAYWSMSPNARHPFPSGTRLIERIGMKNVYRRLVNARANDYPAYYNLCSDTKILNAVNRLNLPVSQIDFYYVPNVQWDMYFPKRLRFVPHFIERSIVLKNPKLSSLFIFCIRKSAD